ncbi:MAG: hypothetical protein AB1650_01665 [Candidatus Omnitrophota bacterium]
MDTKKKTLFYRRAIWQNKHESLQRLLAEAHHQYGTTAQRSFIYSDGEIQGAYIKIDNASIFCQVTYYVPKQLAALIPIPSETTFNDVTTIAPPKNNNYMEGEIFFMVNNNDLVLCPSGVRESVAIEYIKEILKRSYRDDIDLFYSIEPVADFDKYRLLQREGVKKISLNAALYEASVNYSDRHSAKKMFFNDITNDIRSLFLKDSDEDLRHIDQKENISLKLELSFDSRKKGGQVGKKRMLGLSKKLMDQDNGFSITTAKGNVITAEDMRLKMKVEIPVQGKSLSREAVFNCLGHYYKELTRTGLTEL